MVCRVLDSSDRINQQLISKRLIPSNTDIYAFARIYSVEFISFDGERKKESKRTDVISSERTFHDHTQPVLCRFRLISCLTNRNHFFFIGQQNQQLKR